MIFTHTRKKALNDFRKIEMMGQAVRKMRSETKDSFASSSSADIAAADINDKTSSSSQWITEVPTRSSSLFSDPTGYSSRVTTKESKLTNSFKTSDELEGTQNQLKVRKSASIASSPATSSSSNTSLDHPHLPRLNLSKKDSDRQEKDDKKWQEAVDIFLQHDPIVKTPRHRTRAEYLIRRNYCLIKRDTGFRWKKAVEKFQARRIFPSIPIPNSEWSEA